MSIPAVCPSCGAKAPLDAFLQDRHARQALVAALRVAPGLEDRVLQYLQLFAPPQRAIRMERLARLLEELAAELEARAVSRNGRRFEAPVECWARALDEVIGRRDRLSLPLKDHAYLREVVAGIATRGEAEREQRTEEHRQQRRADSPPAGERAGPVAVGQLAARAGMPESVREHLRQQGWIKPGADTSEETASNE